MPFGNLGYGLMQPGGSFGGPLAAQQARDPRLAMAQALMRQGTDTSPIQSPWQGLSRMAQAGLGGYMMGKTNEDWTNRENNRALAMSNALKDMQGTPAETKAYGDGTTINWNAKAPDVNRGIAGLMANRDTADMGMNMALQEQQYQRGRADRIEDRTASQGFTREMAKVQHDYGVASMELQQAFQAAQQDKSFAAQERLQKAQQAFSAAQQAGQQAFALASAAPIAQAQTQGVLAAQNAPIVIQTPQGAREVPAGAAVGIAKEGGSLNESQSNAATFADRMANANKDVERLQNINKGATGAMGAAYGSLPVIGNMVSSEDRQLFERAKKDFVTAVLRKESGASIAASEFENEDRKYFPQVGDSDRVIAEKAQARAIALQGMQRAAGSGYRPSGGSSVPPPPSSDAVAAEMRRRGLLPP